MDTSPPSPRPRLIQRASDFIRKHLLFDGVNILGLNVKPKTLGGTIAIALVVVMVVSFELYSHLPIALEQKGAETYPDSIGVFLPDFGNFTEDSFYQDGIVQKRGFDKAVQDASALPHRLAVKYYPMRREDTPGTVLDEMKKAYDNGTIVFVMTMSQKVGDLQRHFKRWHDECVHDSKRPPILIVTVASAPDLADASGGIFRWYVRSEEESSLLAEYMRWKRGVAHVGVFFITRNAHQTDDAYGKRGMEVFRTRFSSLGGTLSARLVLQPQLQQARLATFWIDSERILI